MDKPKWYFRTSVLVIAILSVGPLALPLLWANPRFSPKNKALITTAVLVATYLMVVWTIESLKALKQLLP